MAKRKFVFYLGLSFILGTLSAGKGVSFWSALILFLAVVGFAIILRARAGSILATWKDLRTIAVFSFLCLFAGFFYYHFSLNIRNQQITIPLNQDVVFEGVISSDPEGRNDYQVFRVSLATPFKGKTEVFSPSFPRFEYGDLLRISGRIEESRFQDGSLIVFYPELQLVKIGEGFWLKEKLIGFKNFLIGKFSLFFDSDQAALLAGLTFGDRGRFSAGLKEDMARSGVTHIVALSGYNIAILALAIERAFSHFLSRKKRFYLTLGLIFIFVLMVGGEASVVRAAIMGALALLAQHVGRPHDVIHLVVLTAVGMVLIDPTMTAFNIGFQLSFLSLLGILLIEPALRKIFNFKKQTKESFLAWKENGLTTISAQLAVLPVLVVNFDYFSLTSVLANILILFAVPFLMFLGFLFAALAATSGFLGFFVAKVAGVLLFYQIAVIKFFSFVSVPFGRIESPLLIYVIFYGGIAIFIMFSRKYEKVR